MGGGWVRKEKEIIEKKSSGRDGEMETKTRWFCFLLMEILIPLRACVCVCFLYVCDCHLQTTAQVVWLRRTLWAACVAARAC